MVAGKASVSAAGSVAGARAADTPEDGRGPGRRDRDRERERGGARDKYYPPPFDYAEEDQGKDEMGKDVSQDEMGNDEPRQLDQLEYMEDQRRRKASAREHRMHDMEASGVSHGGWGEYFPPRWDQVCTDRRV
jgi:hypothetical protein